MKISIYNTQVEILLAGSNDIKYKFANCGDSNQNIIKYLKEYKDNILTLLHYGTQGLENYNTLEEIEDLNHNFLYRAGYHEYVNWLSREEAERLAMQEFNNGGNI